MIPIKDEIIWRPRMHKQSVSINQEGRFFAVTCRSLREADLIMKALIKAFIKSRGRRSVRDFPGVEVVPVIKGKK